ncbi:hypothetical protein BGW80DRAFT_1455283 [Lactifluus volemus]|nr:hypothetical protein BGW80DRAFT_1455283 [Lactifluus volemus]
MSQPPQPLPISYLYAIAEHRALPEPFELPSFQYDTQGPQVDHARSMPSNYNQDSHRGPPQCTVTHSIPIHGPVLGGQSQGFPGVDGTQRPSFPLYDPYSAPSWSYIAKLKMNNTVANTWDLTLLNDLAYIERNALFDNTTTLRPRILEFWKSWVNLHMPGLRFRDMVHKVRMIEQTLIGYDWFVGMTTMCEAIPEMLRFEGLLKQRMAARRSAQEKKLAHDKAAEMLVADRRKVQVAQAQAHAQQAHRQARQ